jgi:hypothetical protein
MNIGVACFTLGRRRFEIDSGGSALAIRRLVACAARRSEMRAGQGEYCFRVIEAREIVPGLGGVAGFATGQFAAVCWLRHQQIELSAVGIHMAGRATQNPPMVARGWWHEVARQPMAVAAGDCLVASCKLKVR